MQHLAMKAAAAAILVGAGTGAMKTPDAPDIPRDALNPMIGGQAMLTDDNIFDNTIKSPEHTKLAAAIRASGLESMLKTNGPYTVFAPTDAAFAALPRAEQTALADGAKDRVAKEVRYLVVPGRLDSQTLLKRINDSGGEAKLKTVEGGTLTAMLNGPTNIALVDERGDVADISIYDVYQSNGVIQVVDHALMPR
ncbi:MAG TPA: fasciclin domain-containing protein [Rhizomicrobium sp.]|jgi:uncharacterized surface protein with fasciclin (FAS1) repeats